MQFRSLSRELALLVLGQVSDQQKKKSSQDPALEHLLQKVLDSLMLHWRETLDTGATELEQAQQNLLDSELKGGQADQFDSIRAHLRLALGSAEKVLNGLSSSMELQRLLLLGDQEQVRQAAMERAALVMEHRSSIDAGLDAVILTQFSFDTDPVMAWIKGVRDRGIDTQIRLGTPGPAGIKRLISFASRFGVGANAMIVKKYGFSLTNLMGSAGPDKFVSDLAALFDADPSVGAVKLHMYTFGGLEATATWARDFIAK